MAYLLLLVVLAVTVVLPLAVVIWVYVKNRFTPNGERRSLSLYIFGVILSFFLAGLAMAVFLRVGCPEGSGNLCVFGASLIAQPVALLICMGGYLFLWVRKGKHYVSK